VSRVSFNKPHLTGKELHYITSAATRWGSCPVTVHSPKRCNAWLEQHTGCREALLDTFLHRCARNGGDPRRHSARR